MQDQCSQDERVARRGNPRLVRALAALLIAAAIPLGAALAQQPAPPPAAGPSSPPPPSVGPAPTPPPPARQPQAAPGDIENAPPTRRDRRQARQDRMEERAERERERRHARDWRRSMGPFALAPLCGPRFGRRLDDDLRRIARAVAPTEAQRGSFDDLRAAAATARDQAQEGCNEPAAQTPTGRLQLIEERLASVQQAVRTLRPPLDALYASLNDEQKARFDDLNLSMTAGAEEAPPRERRRRWRSRYYHPIWPFW